MEKVNYYLKIFLIGSMLGYLMETILKIFHPQVNNGILYGPWVPLYGFGSILIIIILRLIFNRTKLKRGIKIILTLVMIVLVVTILELIGGIMIEKLFHKVFWNYSKMKFNIGKYISLEMSLLWGVLSLIFIYLIKPLLEKIIKKIPNLVWYIMFSIFLIDVVVTSLKIYK